MIKRVLEKKLKQLATNYPVVSVTGPRQSGKTTLVRSTFKKLPYVSLENPDDREFAINDPRKFLENYPDGAVFDEAQRVPSLFSYLQGIVDNDSSKKYILSGSQNFLLSEQISQSLAGRVGILKLLPFSMLELKQGKLLKGSFEDIAYTGFYPRIFDKKIPPQDFYPSYVQTYVERDVRLITKVNDLNTFTAFIKLCAGRAGQLLVLSELANDVGASVNTIKSWLSILESSYLIFRLFPHHKNFNKRLIKMPKLYFYDTGLLCYLLGISNAQQIQTHFAKGAIFENLIIADLLKQRLHAGMESNLSFWRDNKGREIDTLIDRGDQLIPIELKSGSTKSMNFFKGIEYWNKLSNNDPKRSYVVYGGNQDQSTSKGQLLSWNSILDFNVR